MQAMAAGLFSAGSHTQKMSQILPKMRCSPRERGLFALARPLNAEVINH